MYTKAQLLEKTSAEESQVLFLRAAADHPKIRLEESLREQVLPRWQPLWQAGLYKGGEVPPEYENLIREWAAGNRLPYDWVVGHARRAVLFWLAVGPKVRAFESRPEPSPPIFRPGLRLPEEQDATYLARQVRQFRKEFRAHLLEVRDSRKSVLKHRGSLPSHYQWAVEHICLAWSWSKISQENGTSVTYQAVRQAVLPILAKIGVPDTRT